MPEKLLHNDYIYIDTLFAAKIIVPNQDNLIAGRQEIVALTANAAAASACVLKFAKPKHLLCLFFVAILTWGGDNP